MVQSFDASQILKFLVNLIELDSLQMVIGDVSADTSLSTLDASLILQYVVGLIDELPYIPGMEFMATGDLTMADQGADPGMLVEIPIHISNGSNIYGFTGTIQQVNPEIIDKMLEDDFVPVIAPIASGGSIGHPGYNINADLAASQIAVALGARKLVFLTDTPGVLDQEGNLLSNLSIQQTNERKEDGTISGGMVPKVDACIDALRGSVKKAHIIDGRVEHSLLLELLTNSGIGTCIEL